jgi:hypothetical protein
MPRRCQPSKPSSASTTAPRWRAVLSPPSTPAQSPTGRSVPAGCGSISARYYPRSTRLGRDQNQESIDSAILKNMFGVAVHHVVRTAPSSDRAWRTGRRHAAPGAALRRNGSQAGRAIRSSNWQSFDSHCAGEYFFPRRTLVSCSTSLQFRLDVPSALYRAMTSLGVSIDRPMSLQRRCRRSGSHRFQSPWRRR